MRYGELRRQIKNYILPQIPLINLNALSNRVVKIYDREITSIKELCLLTLKRHPSLFISLFCSYIEYNKIRVDLLLESEDSDYKESDKVTILSVLKVDTYSRILQVNLLKYRIPEIEHASEDINLISDFNDSYLNLAIITHNGFNCSVIVKGYATGGHTTLDIVDYWHPKAELGIWGLKKGIEVPSWVEFLVDSALHAESGNDRMAFLNIFAAFENLIATLHDEMFFEYFLARDITRQSVKDNIRLFANKNISLRNKLNQIVNTVGFRKDKFSKFHSLIKKWEDLIVKRDTIAHGGRLNADIDIAETMYMIMTIIYTLALHQDLELNGWISLFQVDPDENGNE